jgi:hypothetical protein
MKISPDDKEWGHLFSRRTDDALDWEETSSLGTSNGGPLYRIE